MRPQRSVNSRQVRMMISGATQNTPYKFGLNARQAADECRKRVKKCLGVKDGKVIFCGNASEAAKILCDRLQAYGIFTTCGPYEHDSVYDLVD